ncbi:hypothetical protein EK0264_15885 [Epidermidibacterium keratini]|uniref:DUF3558 domain-containing protein n=1 Tax=Epidermidibacterium keratini TaxID=1891644 RepID=A0A7L4YRV5_9ACTN|nr:hypothetical protein [Epidermidibacterium keratini]QHC01624.1 hypothetical protein EK0264_15885 [Epidermidibacterium keratini]
MAWGITKVAAVLVVAVTAGALSACSSVDFPSCDVVQVDVIEEYAGSPVTLDQQTSKQGDIRVCRYQATASDARDESTVSLWFTETDSPLDEYEPNSAAQPQDECGQNLQVVTDCQTGDVGGGSWCEISDGAQGPWLSIKWMRGDFAVWLSADPPFRDSEWQLATCDDMEELAEQIDAALRKS